MKEHDYHKRPQGQTNVLQLRCEPLEKVRIGFVGLGVRAKRAVQRMLHIANAEVTAICDLVEENIADTQKIISSQGAQPAVCYSDPDGWRRICELPNVDLIYICTDWLSHAQIATYAMECGKHAAVEVPAAMTVNDCWLLVDTAERTRRHCMMLENCCYDEFELTLLRMANEGVLGEIIHAEGAYLHDLRRRVSSNDGGGRKWANWQVEFMNRHTGNPYPTHGLGPVALAMGIHRGDRMKSIVSVSSKNIKSECDGNILTGNINSSIITTQQGHTISVQHCISLPHPYSRSFLLSGTKGFAQKYPVPQLSLDPEGDRALMGEECNEILRRYTHPFVAKYKKTGEALCGRRWIDYAMDSRLIHCLCNGLPTDIDVYDAAEWSCLVELTEQSVTTGRSIEIPDFTRGDWDTVRSSNFNL